VVASMVISSNQGGVSWSYKYGWELWFFVPIVLGLVAVVMSWERWNKGACGWGTVGVAGGALATSWLKPLIFIVAGPPICLGLMLMVLVLVSSIFGMFRGGR